MRPFHIGAAALRIAAVTLSCARTLYGRAPIICFQCKLDSRVESQSKRQKKKRFGVVNVVLFSKSMSNIFITVQKVTINIFLICKTIPEFVALGQARSQSRKTIENLIKPCFGRYKWDLFSKPVSKKFQTLNNVFVNMFLIIEAISEFDASKPARSRSRKSIENAKENVFWRLQMGFI